MEDLEKLSKKKKYVEKFDIVVCGFIHSHIVSQDYFKALIHKGSVIFLEKAK